MITRKHIITINGSDYYGHVAKITGTTLGLEDHGCATYSLSFDAEGFGGSFGNIVLDDVPTGPGEPRRGTAFGLDHILRLMEALGVRRWEDLAGRDVMILNLTPNPLGATAVGIMPLRGDTYFTLDGHLNEWNQHERDIA